MIYVLLILLLGDLILLMIPALRRNFAFVVCEGRCKPSVVHSHYGLEHLCSARVMEKRSDKPEKPPQGRLYRLACVIMLLDVDRAATEEQD